MSKFETPIKVINKIEEIVGADAIEVAMIGGFRTVVRKNSFSVGELAVYLPEDSILPDYLINHLGLEGRLAGSAKNRIKAVKLRGCLSQGILIKSIDNGYFNGNNQFREIISEGDDFSEFFGVTKYEPIIPGQMAGEVANVGRSNLIKFDVENWKKYPDIIQDGEIVEFSEKCHGTFTSLARFKNSVHPEVHEAGFICAASKGLGSQGLAFKDNEKNINNIYVKQLLANREALENLYNLLDQPEALYVLGETYGAGVQDLTYGRTDSTFAVFDIFVGKPMEGHFLNFEVRNKLAIDAGFAVVPSLYVGPFSQEVMMEHTRGKTIMGNQAHIREGIVIRVAEERKDDSIGRVMLKSVSEDYLLRKNPDATEFQ